MLRAFLLPCLLAAQTALADPPRIEAVAVSHPAMGWRFDVTLLHPDKDWDHYADRWEVVDSEGHVLGTRELMHPHVSEQPFTRSLTGVMIPDGVRRVWIRAHCSGGDWTTPGFEVTLDPSEG